MAGSDFDTLAEKVAGYIGVVQPQLDRIPGLESRIAAYEKAAAAEKTAGAQFAKRASEALGALADAGLISRNDVSPLVDRSVSDHSAAWDLVEKIAGSVGPAQLGSRSDVVEKSEDDMDPFEREFGNHSSHASGMVD